MLYLSSQLSLGIILSRIFLVEKTENQEILDWVYFLHLLKTKTFLQRLSKSQLKRQEKDKKFGFGGKKNGAKKNNLKKTEARGGKQKAGRPGKSKRAATNAKNKGRR